MTCSLLTKSLMTHAAYSKSTFGSDPRPHHLHRAESTAETAWKSFWPRILFPVHRHSLRARLFCSLVPAMGAVLLEVPQVVYEAHLLAPADYRTGIMACQATLLQKAQLHMRSRCRNEGSTQAIFVRFLCQVMSFNGRLQWQTQRHPSCNTAVGKSIQPASNEQSVPLASSACSLHAAAHSEDTILAVSRMSQRGICYHSKQQPRQVMLAGGEQLTVSSLGTTVPRDCQIEGAEESLIATSTGGWNVIDTAPGSR